MLMPIIHLCCQGRTQFHVPPEPRLVPSLETSHPFLGFRLEDGLTWFGLPFPWRERALEEGFGRRQEDQHGMQRKALAEEGPRLSYLTLLLN
jgi:hypothetical protein